MVLNVHRNHKAYYGRGEGGRAYGSGDAKDEPAERELVEELEVWGCPQRVVGKTPEQVLLPLCMTKRTQKINTGRNTLVCEACIQPSTLITAPYTASTLPLDL